MNKCASFRRLECRLKLSICTLKDGIRLHSACVFKNSFVPCCEKERKTLFGLALKMELIQIFFAGCRWKTLVGR